MLHARIIGALLLPAVAAAAGPDLKLSDLPLSTLEQRLSEIDAELAQLARYSLRSGVGAIGYRSEWHGEAGSQEWVEVSLDTTVPINAIVLVPTLWRDSTKGFQSDGFPGAFRVVAGTGSDRKGSVLATVSSTDNVLPRIAPLVIPVSGIEAAWVRIEATQLTRRAFDNSYVLQLSELMVFSGERNVALRRPVKASSVHTRDLPHAWDLPFLVDGHMPYLMDAAQGTPSVAYIGSTARHPAFTLDLGAAYSLIEIHLHAVDQSDTVPQSHPGDVGLPERLLIEGALQPDFSDAILLLEIQQRGYTQTGPVMMWPLPTNTCRYVRVRTPEQVYPARFGFAEIELFSEGKNIALNKSVQAGAERRGSSRSLDALTDGRNLYGDILPVRSWVTQLARRHDLEIERPLVEAALNQRYARQKMNLRRLAWLTVLLTGGIVVIALIDRISRMRREQRIRERFAADLHDEVGADIHTIGLLTDLARDTETHDELLELLDQTRVFTERSGAAVRFLTTASGTDSLCEDLVEEMKRSSDRLLGDMEHQLTIEGEEVLANLKPRKRIDLFFFYKEALNNIVRHAEATLVSTRLVADARHISLIITDNGSGIQHSSGRNSLPSSLKRRARILGASASAEPAPGGGTRIALNLRLRRWRIRR